MGAYVNQTNRFPLLWQLSFSPLVFCSYQLKLCVEGRLLLYKNNLRNFHDSNYLYM